MPRSLRSLWVSLSVLVLVGLPVAASDGWTSFRGSDGAGEAADGLPAGDGPVEFEVAWKRSFGSGYSGVSVADGKAVTGEFGGDRDYVVALDSETGDEIWRYDLAEAYPGHDGSHDGPIATPAIADGRVFMVAPRGEVAALDLSTGEALWTAHLVDDLGCEKPYYGFGGSPAVVGDVVVMQVGGEEGSVVGLDVGSGEVRWRSVTDAGDVGSQSPTVATIGGREQVLVLSESKVSGLDPASGEVLWEQAFEGESGEMGSMTQSPLAVDGDRIFVKHGNHHTVVVEVRSGEDGWTPTVALEGSGLSRSYSPPAKAGEALFGYTARFLSALDLADGELLWRSREPGDGFLVSVGDRLVVVTKEGRLHLGAASREGWESTTELDLFEDLAWTPPSFAGGALYLRSLGEIARVDLRRGETSMAGAGEDSVLPAVLAGLAREIEAAEDSAAVVDGFLEGRELPLVDGEEVVFLWHGPAEDVAVAGDMIGMRTEEPMKRLEGTDLWWWSTQLDPRARISYVFYVDYELAADPTHDRTVSTTVLGPDMNWFRGEPVTMSWFAMPEWPGLATESGEPVAAASRMDSLEISVQPPTAEEGEAPEAVEVPVHVWLPPGYDEGDGRYPAVYVHHAGARTAGRWPETLDRVVGATVEPLIVVFLEAPRMRGFGKLFVEQIVPEIDARYRTRAEREGRANVGMGWPGVGATAVTFQNPDTFGALGLQSLFLVEEPMKEVEESVGDTTSATAPLRIYLEWGRWDLISPHEEMNMRESGRWAWDLFESKGYQPMGGEVWDSTDFASWSNRTGLLLEALFPAGGEELDMGDWSTAK